MRTCARVRLKMLRQIALRLKGRRVVLASGSPRRREILQNIGFPFEVHPSQFEEDLDKASFQQPCEYAVENSRRKAREVAERLKSEQDWAVIVAADTIVIKDGEILEKPKTEARAREMLHRLSGVTHTVCTGMTLVCRRGEGEQGGVREHSFKESTEVTFTTLSDEIIEDYISSGEPLDKAGAYGIQGLGGTLVSSITGDYFNVVGLPLHRFCSELMAVLVL